MIYKKENIDMSLVECPYEEEQGYIYISDEYTNNVLKLSGYNDIDERCFADICENNILSSYHSIYSLTSAKHSYLFMKYTNVKTPELLESVSKCADSSYRFSREVIRDRFEIGEEIISSDAFLAICMHIIYLEVDLN